MKRHGRIASIVLVLSIAATTANVHAIGRDLKQPVRDYCWFLNRLVDLDGLPFLEKGLTCKQFSSYDRKSRYDAATGKYVGWDANKDWGNYLRIEGKEAVMAEMKGPGCICRIWSANPQGEIRFYLDGDKEPTFAMDFADLFSGEIYPFVPPFVWQRRDAKGNARASHCYLPIPYAKSCKVTVYPRVDMYYHIGYQTFPPGTKVETFHLKLKRNERATLRRVRKILRNAFDASTMSTEAGKAEVKLSIDRKDKVPPDPQGRLLQRYRRPRALIAPGEAVIVAEMKGPGIVTSFKARLVSKDPQAFRRVLLRVYWDGEERPSIEAPLCDFFGSSFGPTIYHSLPMGKTSKWFYSYWRMPFRKSACFEIVNEGPRPAQVYCRFAWHKARLPENTAYFHAKWRRDPYSKDFDYPFLECTGRGRFVGVAHFIHNIAGGWWGEGDEKVYVDGEKFPSTFGTGSEDYYGDAWGIRWFSNPYAGCPYSSNNSFAAGQEQSCYRWHIADFIPFERSFKITIENYSAKTGPDHPKNDYSSVAYWYQMPGGSDFFRPYPVSERLVRVAAPKEAIEAESVAERGALPKGVSILKAEESDDPLSGGAALRIVGQVGDTFDLPLEIPVAQAYRIAAKTVAPTNGRFVILKNDWPIGDKVFLKKGVNPLAIRLTWKPNDAEREEVVLDYFELIPYRKYVTKWLVIGPFDNAGRKGFDRVYPPEKEFKRNAVYDGAGGKKIRWREVGTNPRTGLVALSDLYSPSQNTVAYAICTVTSPRDQTMDLFAGSDDSIKIWLNGELVWNKRADRGYREDEDHLKVHLKKGVNTILVKVDNGGGPTGFGLRIADPQETLKYGLPK